jgi:hypothetical protein
MNATMMPNRSRLLTTFDTSVISSFDRYRLIPQTIAAMNAVTSDQPPQHYRVPSARSAAGSPRHEADRRWRRTLRIRAGG